METQMQKLQVRDPVNLSTPSICGDMEIEISDRAQTDAEFEADLKSLMGMARLDAGHVRKLKSVGVHLKRMGIVETQRGTVFVNQVWLMAASQELHRLLLKHTKDEEPDIETIILLSKQLCELAEKQGRLASVMMLQEPKEPGSSGVAMPFSNSFPAGAVVVGGNGQANIYQSHPPRTLEDSKKTVAE